MESLPAGGAPPPPVYHSDRGRRRSLVGPLLLIALGLLFLGQNLGLYGPEVWAGLWRLWPLVLVLLGAELILGRSSVGSAVGLLVLTVVVVAFIASITFFVGLAPWSFDRGIRFGQPAVVERVTEELGDVRGATIDLTHGAGRLSVEALPADSSLLMDADLSHGENTIIDRTLERQGDRVTMQLRGRSQRDGVPVRDGVGEDWDIGLSPRVPTELRIRSGASETNLDLSNLLVTRLDVEVGAAGLTITMPRAAGRTEARVKAGAAGVNIEIPEGVAARIRHQGGLSGTTVDESRFPKVGNYYQSRDYDEAQNRLDLQVETGVSGVRIR